MAEGNSLGSVNLSELKTELLKITNKIDEIEDKKKSAPEDIKDDDSLEILASLMNAVTINNASKKRKYGEVKINDVIDQLEVSRLRKEDEDLTRNNRDLESLSDNLEKSGPITSNQFFGDKLDEKESAKGQLSLESKEEASVDKIKNLEAELAKANYDMAVLMVKNEDLMTSRIREEDTLLRLKKENKELKVTNETYQRNLEIIGKDNIKLQEEVSGFQLQKQRLYALEGIEKEYEALTKINELREDELYDFNKEHEALKAELSETKAELSNCNVLVKQAEMELSNMEELFTKKNHIMLEKLSKHSNDSSENFDVLLGENVRITQENNELKKINEDNAAKIEELQKALKTLKDDKFQLSKENSKYLYFSDCKERDINKFKQIALSYKEKYNELSTKVEELKKTGVLSHTMISDLNFQITTLYSQIETLFNSLLLHLQNGDISSSTMSIYKEEFQRITLGKASKINSLKEEIGNLLKVLHKKSTTSHENQTMDTDFFEILDLHSQLDLLQSQLLQSESMHSSVQGNEDKSAMNDQPVSCTHTIDGEKMDITQENDIT